MEIETPAPWEKALKDFVVALRAEFSGNIEEIILYGSRARDDSNPESDIDVLIVISGLNPDAVFPRIIDMAIAADPDWKYFISPKVVDIDWFNTRRNYSFYRAIAEEGVAI